MQEGGELVQGTCSAHSPRIRSCLYATAASSCRHRFPFQRRVQLDGTDLATKHAWHMPVCGPPASWYDIPQNRTTQLEI